MLNIISSCPQTKQGGEQQLHLADNVTAQWLKAYGWWTHITFHNSADFTKNNGTMDSKKSIRMSYNVQAFTVISVIYLQE